MLLEWFYVIARLVSVFRVFISVSTVITSLRLQASEELESNYSLVDWIRLEILDYTGIVAKDPVQLHIVNNNSQNQAD